MRLLLLLGLLVVACPPVKSSATLQFKLHSFSNPDHRELDGDCCDDIWLGCDDFCDNRFIVCLDEDSSSGSDFNQCDIADESTGTFQDDDSITFPGTIPAGIANPISRQMDSWPGGMRVKVQVWDVDGNNDDKVDEDYRTIDQSASRTLSSATWQTYTLGQQSVFTFKVRVFCNLNYYSSECSVYCYPTDNQNGHYRCDPGTGAKLCYSGWEGTNCNLDLDECQSSPCANGAMCTNLQNRYECTCTDGWTGTHCDENIDDCVSDPCKNGGTCLDHVAYFTCSCPTGHVYADEFCEYDDCAGQPCHDGATCIDLIDTFQCTCPLGYFGDLCELDIDYCINKTCQNNGTCVDRIDGFHCLCQTGFNGTFCETEIDECASQPCMHNSTCQDLIGNYNCTCQSGYQGDNCEAETDECLSSPCMNNATCFDEFDGYQCLCIDGFEGAHCETDTDECVSSPCYSNETCMDEINGYRCLRVNQCDYTPCQNNASCVDDYPGFICVCMSGYGGKTCDEDTDECESSPCLHGTCVDHLNGYSCLCSPGFAGKMCRSETNECLSSPCDNGVCDDQIDGFVCNCTAGYTGVLCENDIDECASSPCEQGRCVDGINEYICECIVSCVNGHCYDGVCFCDPGYEGDNCTVETDFCRSSPCSQGTCIPLLNSYRCECDSVFTGKNCESVVDDPCFFSPCDQGTCNEKSVPSGITFECTCDPGFAGKHCDADMKLNGASIMIKGRLDNKSEFQLRMAVLLQRLMPSTLRHVRDTDGDTVHVEVVMTEDYVGSTNGGALTKVTFIAWTESGYLTKDYIHALLGNAPTKDADLGYSVFNGESEPLNGMNPETKSNWYVFLIVAAVIGIVVVGGFIAWRRGHTTSFGKNPFRTPRQSAGLPSLNPPDAMYSTRINDFTTLTADTASYPHMTASINPAYIPSCFDKQQPDEGYGGDRGEASTEPEFCLGATGGEARASNIYDEIPALSGEASGVENPYLFVN
ncbi:fibropellin-1-like [Asterias rubens]|uniref:fibropellin-1-like n=1 Tax=Asterias rubens TaxID=7604 RepID=UPI001455BFB7|nr:fibropellin-1-like [Asterias rubens]